MSPGGVFSLRDLQAITQKGPVFLGRQLKRIPQAFNLEPVGQRKLARLAGRYNKIPDRKKISTKQPVARFFEELGLNYAESAHVLRTYAKTLKDHPVKPRELDPALELILALTTGERRENIVIEDDLVQMALHHKTQQILGLRAQTHEYRSRMAEHLVERFGWIDRDVPHFCETSRKWIGRAEQLRQQSAADVAGAIALLTEVEGVISRGDQITEAIPRGIILDKAKDTDSVSIGTMEDSDQSRGSISKEEEFPGQKAYRESIEQLLQHHGGQVDSTLKQLRKQREQLCAWAGLPTDFIVWADLGAITRVPNAVPIDHGIDRAVREHEPARTTGNRGLYAWQKPIQFAERLFTDGIAQVIAHNEVLAAQFHQRANDGRFVALSKTFQFDATALVQEAADKLLYQPNGKHRYRINDDVHTDVHELFIHRAISLLNTIASGKQIGYPNLGLEFTVDNGGTKPASGRFLSKHVRLWHGDKLIVTQARASRAKFWSQLVSDTHVGQERRTISRTALRATVELLVEKHFHGQLSPQERRSIDAKDRAWVDRNGIELTQIFGLEAELSDLGGIDRNRLFEQGPRFAKEANAILDALIQHPTPAFRPFVAQLKDRHPRIAWDSESRRVAFLYDKR